MDKPKRTASFASRRKALELRIEHTEGRLVALKNELFVLIEEQKKKLAALAAELNGIET